MNMDVVDSKPKAEQLEDANPREESVQHAVVDSKKQALICRKVPCSYICRSVHMHDPLLTRAFTRSSSTDICCPSSAYSMFSPTLTVEILEMPKLLA